MRTKCLRLGRGSRKRINHWCLETSIIYQTWKELYMQSVDFTLKDHHLAEAVGFLIQLEAAVTMQKITYSLN